MMAKKLRLLKMALSTLLLGRKRGYFLPYRYAAAVPPLNPEICYGAIADTMQAAHPQLDANIAGAAEHLPRFNSLPDASQQARFEQDWFPRLDAVMAYSMVAQHRPARIIEVGCGHSTRFMTLALRDKAISCEFVAIDPSPRARLPQDVATDHICDYVQNVPLATFADLQNNDIFFIDSSHLLVPGSDVDFLLNAVLPTIPRGVLIHIHDIFLPFDYPQAWHWRGYNEQSAVAAVLNGGTVDVLWSSVYALQNHQDALRASGLLDLPMLSGAYETSLWLRKL